MTRCRLLLSFLLTALVWLPVRADDDADSAPLPPAAKRVLEDAEKAVAKNRRAFEAANDASLDEAEKALKAVMDGLTKDGKLEEALATKKLLTTFREQVAGSADASSKPKPSDASKRQPVAKTPAKGGKVQFNEQFGFTDEKRVKDFWEFEGEAKEYQFGSNGVTTRGPGVMRSRIGLVGDFEIGVKMNSIKCEPEVLIAGNAIKFVHPNPATLMRIVRKGNNLLVDYGGAISTYVISEDKIDQPQYLAIKNRCPIEVGAIVIKAMKVVRPEE